MRTARRLLLVTPPVRRVVHGPPGGKQRVELRWTRRAKPFRYNLAPSLFEAPGLGRLGLFPKLTASIASAHRSTIDAKFASRFRARTRPLQGDLARELIAGFEKAAAQAKPGDLIRHYTEALPEIDPGAVIRDRKAAYRDLRQELGRARRCCHGVRQTRC